MSWSWRSKETYGDKSADFEGDEAEKPVADEGAEKPKKKSIWDDDKTSWWDEYEKTSSTSRRTGSQQRDESYRVYSYDDAFDDSDSRWYRKNSFRYDGYRDYSPSRLFRSSFSSSIGFGSYSSSSGDNELKNKAIRALRSLTRNANTVANKAAKINYSVKFSAGADINGAADTLGAKTGKQQEQIIYVSPDELAKTDSDDETDAAIDALTGFVLLRVQLSQGVDRSVIDAVNATAMQAVPTKLAQLLMSTTVTKELAQDTAQEYTDNYAAGILTKGMLTRLARRGVVKDWGGFAPYFVRHAKKFAAVREKLTSGEGESDSVELLSAQIAYNFISDENPISLPKEIEEIVAKHLGEELAAEQLLPACQALVSELRAHLAKEGKLGSGQLETALHEILEELVTDSSPAPAEMRKALESHLEDVADCIDKIFKNAAAQDQSDKSKQRDDAHREADKAVQNIKMLQKFSETATSLMAHMSAEMNNAASSFEYDPSSAPRASERAARGLAYALSTMDSNIAHYGTRLKDVLEKHGCDINTLGSPHLPVTSATPFEEIKSAFVDYDTAAKAVIEKIAEIVKKEIKDARQQAVACYENAAKDNATLKQKLAELKPELERLKTAAQDLAMTNPDANDAYAGVTKMLEIADNVSNLAETREKFIEDAVKRTAKTRTPSNLSSAMSRVKSIDVDLDAALHNVVREAQVYTGSRPMANFFNVATSEHYNEKELAAEQERPYNLDPSWHANAIKNFFAASATQQTDFTTALINKTHSELLKNLLKQLKHRPGARNKDDSESDGEDSGGLKPFYKLTPEQKALVENVAASLGLNSEQLFKMLENIDSIRPEHGSNAKAEKLGEQIKEKLIAAAAELSPVDEELFGEQVKNTVKAMLGESLDTVHDEATRSVEEDFVAYLSHNDARPVIKVAAQPMNLSQARRIAKEVAKTNRGAVEKIRDALNFQSNKRVGEVYGLTSGDLDEGNLHKLRYDSEHIWSQKTITRLPDVAVGILVDQSGSMGSCDKIEQAREMCIVLAEAIKQIQGVHLHIYGHTANRGSEASSGDLQLFEHYSSYGDARTADLGRLGGITAMSNNYDGYAIKETAKRLSLDPAKKKYLFVIADGLPSGRGYGGNEAEKHVKSVCSYVRNKLKISTYAFGVGVHSAGDIQRFKSQYGENNLVFISQVQQALPKIVRFLRNVLQKEKTLIDITAD